MIVFHLSFSLGSFTFLESQQNDCMVEYMSIQLAVLRKKAFCGWVQHGTQNNTPTAQPPISLLLWVFAVRKSRLATHPTA